MKEAGSRSHSLGTGGARPVKGSIAARREQHQHPQLTSLHHIETHQQLSSLVSTTVPHMWCTTHPIRTMHEDTGKAVLASLTHRETWQPHIPS
ncbi:hypothetical protein E2C01_054371 [Portunus trituberculatus]|uniref:Uncharacterized protein n=1 Tax=Portunus trituberculatus TaxID=210409 RepID=A0A5B7GJ70_PORTR|nr:hypothetical protein [Portunus trituberculatus]